MTTSENNGLDSAGYAPQTSPQMWDMSPHSWLKQPELSEDLTIAPL